MGESGESFVYGTAGPPPGSSSGAFLNFTLADRGSTGWDITPLGFPYALYSESILTALAPLYPAAFSEDLRTAMWISSVPLTADAPPEGDIGLYREVTGGVPQFIAKVGTGFPLFYENFADIASDGSRVVFVSSEHLLPGDAGRAPGGQSIYEWDGSALQLVDVNNDGSLMSTCGADISRANGMSASANRVFFTCGGVEEVYLRDLDAGTTTEISASQCTRVDCDAPQPVYFYGATHDGRFAFLESAQQLTNDDHDSSRDLYRYDVNTGELSLLSGGSSETSGEIRQDALVYPSEDGSHVYFLAAGDLKPGEATTGEKLFVAGPSGLDLVAAGEFPSPQQIEPSADGERVLFTTQTQVLSNDTDSEADAYLYDANQKTITRVSAGLGGGNGPFQVHLNSPVERPEYELGDHRQFHSLDASGERAFFWTTEKLLPEDVNNKADVYEWWNGQLGLISPGKEETDSAFAGASGDGRSVLFATNASLSPADQDGGNRDYYVARLEGGFPEGAQEGSTSCDSSACPFPARSQISRPALRSTRAPRGKQAKIRVLGIRSAQDGVIGRSTVVLVSVPSPGLVSAQVWSREHGKKVVLATGRAGAVRPGKVRLDLSLTHFGRNSGVGTPRGHLTLEEGDSQISKIVKVDLSR